MEVVHRIRAWFSDRSKAPALSGTDQSPARGDMRRIGLVFAIMAVLASFGWCVTSRCVMCELWDVCR